MTTELCECFIGRNGLPCWHQFYLWFSGLGTCPHFLPNFDKAERQNFTEIVIGASPESSYYDTLHSLKEKNEIFNLAALLMTFHIDVSSEQEHCEGFITHLKEVSCEMDEVSQKSDKFHDSVKKKFVVMISH